jgi:hypothetical protein
VCALWRYENAFIFTNQSEVDFGISYVSWKKKKIRGNVYKIYFTRHNSFHVEVGDNCIVHNVERSVVRNKQEPKGSCRYQQEEKKSFVGRQKLDKWLNLNAKFYALFNRKNVRITFSG